MNFHLEAMLGGIRVLWSSRRDLYTDNRYLHVISQRLQCLAGGAPFPSRYFKAS
ncbi:hypothetical protein M422DRAFT_30276 [Sphaerobolus stellatus SS14]|uniref:Uncharacterized protein n=1 Tax=Sphaerobolus stellatus (strain SS14) TaxID=990650 RepID=A0A0C9W1I8_SPHS4|nr:hypothetical protein M422DRAFT_30276 [Sphaerobolus stellatus SS14]